MQNGRLDIVKADKKRKKVYAPQLYDLTQLQRDANRLYNFSAKETLNYMQRLYEHYKTVERCVSAPEWSAACAQILKDKPKASPRFVNDAKVGDHHAIIPTEQGVRLSELDYGERKIYELVVKRFLAVLMPPYEYDETSVQAQAGGELFEASGRHTVSLGWRSVGRDLDGGRNGKGQRLCRWP